MLTLRIFLLMTHRSMSLAERYNQYLAYQPHAYHYYVHQSRHLEAPYQRGAGLLCTRELSSYQFVSELIGLVHKALRLLDNAENGFDFDSFGNS